MHVDRAGTWCLFLCLCCCYIGSNCDTESGCPVCCVGIDCNLLAWTCMLLKFLVSLILPLGLCPCVATGGIQISQQYINYGQHMIFSNLTISTNKRYIILFKINQTKVRHDIKSKQLASNLIGQCPCDSTDNKCISSNYLQDIFIFVKTYVKYNSRNTKILATISFYLPQKYIFVYLIPKPKLCISTFKHVSWVSTLEVQSRTICKLSYII